MVNQGVNANFIVLCDLKNKSGFMVRNYPARPPTDQAKGLA